MLSSHSSVIGLFLALAGGSLCPCHALRVRVTEDAGIVADEHHAEESPGDLAQPPETSENEKSGGDKARDAQSRYVAMAEGKKKIANNVYAAAYRLVPLKFDSPVNFGIYTRHSSA